MFPKLALSSLSTFLPNPPSGLLHTGTEKKTYHAEATGLLKS